MSFAFSPSNIMAYMTCPRKFWGQSISKLIKWKPSAQKSRGTLLHEQIQDALRNADKFYDIRDDQFDVDYTYSRVQFVQHQLSLGYKLYIEHEMCMSKTGNKLKWFDDKAFLRAKADAFLIHDDLNRPVYIVDIKTGRNWDSANVQLRLESLLAHVIYQRPTVQWEYWYIDQGETEDGLIDFRNGLSQVQDLYDIMREMSLAIKNNDFTCKKNNLCRWCDFNQTKNCDVQ